MVYNLIYMNIKWLVLIVSLFIMFIGVISDIKYRKYPNIIVLLTILTGLVFSYLNNHLIISIIGFIVINIIGIFFHKYKLVASGDMKYLSSTMFFVNIYDINIMLAYIVFLLFISCIVGIVHYKRLNVSLKQEITRSINNYRNLILFKTNSFSSNTEHYSKEEILTKTIPFTLIIFMALILVILCEVIW